MREVETLDRVMFRSQDQPEQDDGPSVFFACAIALAGLCISLNLSYALCYTASGRSKGKKNTNGKYLLTYQVVDIGMMRFWSGDRDILSIPYNLFRYLTCFLLDTHE